MWKPLIEPDTPPRKSPVASPTPAASSSSSSDDSGSDEESEVNNYSLFLEGTRTRSEIGSG